MTTNNLILNGFDRCGSSAISKVLATHPKIELIFHPFNSGSIRRKMYRVMSDDIASPEDFRFFSELEQGRFRRDYVVSPWFKKHSTTLTFIPGRLHILKTTLNHLTIRWVRERFPGIEFWGIWRDPFDILTSLVRNNFYGQWYTDALPQVTETLRANTDFPEIFKDHIAMLNNSEIRSLAFLIAIRSYYFFTYLEPKKLVNYEVFKKEPDAELNKVTDYFGLEKISFSTESDKDYNVIGLDFKKGEIYRNLLDKTEIAFAEEIFKPLLCLMQKRFGEGPWLNSCDLGKGV